MKKNNLPAVNRMFRRSAAILTASVLLGTSFPYPAYAEETGNETTEESSQEDIQETETQTETISISAVDEFLEFSEQCRLDSWSKDKVIELQADLSLTGAGFSGISSFSGVFHGNGHLISGFHLQEGDQAIGLFRYIEEGGRVENLKVRGSFLSTDASDYVGGICGVNAGTVSGCQFEGTVAGKGAAGGIAGLNGADGVITGCSSSGSVISDHSVGGICGINRGTAEHCTNNAGVNHDTSWIDEDDTEGALTDVFGTIEEAYEKGSDIGGVCGISVGTVTNCRNEGTVGYPHSGKNIGGICGRQSGQISGCINIGQVYGKQDVGGICGQDEPFLLQEEADRLKEELSVLHDQGDALMDTLSEMSDAIHADANSLTATAERISGAASSLSNEAQALISRTAASANEMLQYSGDASDVMQEVSDRLTEMEDTIQNEGFDPDTAEEKLKEQLSGTADSMNQLSDVLSNIQEVEIPEESEVIRSESEKINNELTNFIGITQGMNGHLKSYSEAVRSNIQAIRDELPKVEDLIAEKVEKLEKMASGEKTIITDLSLLDPDNASASRISDSKNHGSVQGDVNVGGILGTASDENTDTLSSLQIGKAYDSLLVIDACTNFGTVSARTRYAGGILGYGDQGVIRESVGAGYVHSEAGSYVGGIMGGGETAILDSWSSAVLSGTTYVGGIAGKAKTVRNCRSMAEIRKADSKFGAILGEDDGSDEEDLSLLRKIMGSRIHGNLFLSDHLQGINSVSYADVAEPVSSDTFFAIEDLPETFRMMTILFVDDEDNIIDVRTVTYGADLSELDFPEVPVAEGTYLSWEGPDTSVVHENRVYLKTEVPCVKVLASDKKEGEQSVLYVKGVFTEDTVLSFRELESYDAPKNLPENSESAAYSYEMKGSDLTSESEIPMRIHTGGWDVSHVYVLKNGAWHQVKTERIGSFSEFTATGVKGQILVAGWNHNRIPLYIGIAAGSFAFLTGALILIVVKCKKKRTNAQNEGGIG